MGNSDEITVTYVQSRQSELVGVGYVDWYLLLDILQEVSQYPVRLITCRLRIVMSEIGVEGEQLDFIVAGDLEDAREYIKGKLQVSIMPVKTELSR